MDEYQEHDLEDSTEDLKADLIKLTQLLESELDEIDQFEAEDSLNEGEEDWPQLYAVVGSDESPDVGQHKRRSRELPAGTSSHPNTKWPQHHIIHNNLSSLISAWVIHSICSGRHSARAD
jgi:hypothetical protein